MKNHYSAIEENGFTLLELVITIVIFGIISLFSLGVIAVNARTIVSVRGATTDNWDVRKAMQMLREDVQEIRPQNLFYNNNGNLPARRLKFTALDGTVITYRKQGDLFQRRAGSQPWVELLNTMTTNPFSYLDINSNSTNNRNDVVFIQVSIQAAGNVRTITLEDKFYVRN